MFRFFLNQRYVNLFFCINKKNLVELSKKHGTISHLSNVTDQLVREELIKKEKKGREIEISLTEEGKEWLSILEQANNFATKQLKKIREVKNEG